MQMYHYCLDCDALVLFTTWQANNGRCNACDDIAWLPNDDDQRCAWCGEEGDCGHD